MLRTLSAHRRRESWNTVLSGIRGLSTGPADDEKPQPPVVVREMGSVGLAILNRPAQMNALNKEMCDILIPKLKEWDSSNSPLMAVVMKGAGGKSFSAGGDVKEQALLLKSGHPERIQEFFSANYKCDYIISKMTKPFVSLMDGVTCGGGAGITMHGTFRVATEKTMWGMPEVRIGYFPDSGASHYMNNFPSGRALGILYALRGAPLQNQQVRDAGVATHYIRSKRLSDVGKGFEKLTLNHGSEDPITDAENEVELCLGEIEVNDHWKDAKQDVPDGIFPILKGFAEQYLSRDFECLEEYLDHLEQIKAEGGVLVEGFHGFNLEFSKAITHAFVSKALEDMAISSPISLKLTFELMKRAKEKPLRDCIKMEYRVTKNFGTMPNDFYEGVRAKLIDKDESPKWKYPSVAKVPDSLIREFFHGDRKDDINLDFL
ncbi:hypothetical protein BSKO_09865 [Bryopsis sp. KO-2023]|nr:hypothetical protein BSKO_09865 [Bryopsis sp. KO-2023]